MTASVPLRGKARCEYRRCRRFLGAQRGTGPRRAFCNAGCRRRERTERELASGKGYQPTGRPKVYPTRRQYAEGERFPGTTLTLLRYSEPDQRCGTYGWFACDCGAEKELQLRYVAKGVTRNCADRHAHPTPSTRRSVDEREH
jgi:hypothetical protein